MQPKFDLSKTYVGYIFSVSVTKLHYPEIASMPNVASPLIQTDENVNMHYPSVVYVEVLEDDDPASQFSKAYEYAVNLTHSKHPFPEWTNHDVVMGQLPSMRVERGLSHNLVHTFVQEYRN